jgi:hypothetical protein
MRQLHSEIEIEASPEQVWHLLTDFSRFPEWNPFITRASGQVRQGEKIEVYLQLPEGTGMTFKPRLTKVEPHRELRWLGHLIVPGLFDGEHIFTIEPLADNSVRFIQREVFTGLLSGLLLRMVGENTHKGFQAMNQALKAQVEGQTNVASFSSSAETSDI